jgi:hypothetical protein
LKSFAFLWCGPFGRFVVVKQWTHRAIQVSVPLSLEAATLAAPLGRGQKKLLKLMTLNGVHKSTPEIVIERVCEGPPGDQTAVAREPRPASLRV